MVSLSGFSTNYWQELTEHRIKKKFNTEKDKYQKVIKKYSENIHNKISKLISEKWEKLSNIPELIILENQEKLTNNFKNKKKESGKINHLYKGLIIPINEKHCPITGLNISMQKEISKFLCIAGIRFYYEHEPEIYKAKLLPRLGKKWHTSTLETKYTEIAHSIRNEYFNPKNDPRNNNKNAIFRVLKHPALFNNMQLIDENKKRIAGLI